MITAVTEKFYCQELESESSHCLPGTISVILSLVTSLLKITLNFAISESTVQRRILYKTQLFSAPLRGSSRPEKVPGVGTPNLEGP